MAHGTAAGGRACENARVALPAGGCLLLEPCSPAASSAKAAQGPQAFGAQAAGAFSEYLVWKAVCRATETCPSLAQCLQGSAGTRSLGTAAAHGAVFSCPAGQSLPVLGLQLLQAGTLCHTHSSLWPLGTPPPVGSCSLTASKHRQDLPVLQI